MENGRRSKNKRKGSSACLPLSTKKAAKEEVMMCEGREEDKTGNSKSNLARIIDMASKTANEGGENLCHLASLANFATEERAAKLLIEIGIVKYLGPHLTNKDLKIQEKVAGIFRNLSMSGGFDACTLLIEKGIVTQTGAALTEGVKQMQFFVHKNDDMNLKQVSCCLKQLVSLLWNLCEASDDAIKVLNKESIMVPVLEILILARTDLELLLVTIQCLCTVTEENDNAIAMVANSKLCFEIMSQCLMSYDQGPRRTLIASSVSVVLLNVQGKIEESLREEAFEKSLEIIAHTLRQCCMDGLKKISLGCNENHVIDDCQDLLSAKRICLELLTNLHCYEDDVETMDVSDDGSEDSIHENNQVDANAINATEDVNIFHAHLKELISENDLSERIMDCLAYSAITEIGLLKENPEGERLFRSVLRVQKSTLACFSNLIDMKSIRDVRFLARLWSTVTRMSLDAFAANSQEIDCELCLELTSCLRALVNAMTSENFHEYLTKDFLEKMEKWYKATRDEDSKCHLLKIFGVAGKFHALSEDGEDCLQTIAIIFKRELLPSNSALMMAETLDSTFDAFGEDSRLCDKVLASSGLARLLCQLPSILKTKLKSEKNMRRDCKSLVQSTRFNLNRFISYKNLKP